MHPLVHCCITRQEDAILDGDVATHEGAVGQDAIIRHLAIMADVRVGHEEVLVTNGRHLAGAGAAVHRDVLAENVALANHHIRAVAACRKVLRRSPSTTPIPMSLFGPMVIGPMRWQFAPILQPAATRTGPVIIVNGPTLTSGASSANGSTIAVG